MRKIIISLFFLLLASNIYSQDTISSYFPLAIGNKFVYQKTYTYYSRGMPAPVVAYYILRAEVTDTLTNNGKFYYKVKNFPGFCQTNSSICDSNEMYVRIDTSTGRLVTYIYDGCPYEKYIFKLNANVNDSNGTQCIYLAPGYKCDSYGYEKVMSPWMNDSAITKGFLHLFEYGFTRRNHTYKFSKNFGLKYYEYSNVTFLYSAVSYTYKLKGAVINGVLHGDTTNNVIGIENISSEIPSSYTLHQNYPNPFNPQTKIRFDITKNDFVKLIVYDTNGKEVARLVNEKLNAGSYEVDFNASKLSSGIYYFKIETTGFLQTKKMILVK